MESRKAEKKGNKNMSEKEQKSYYAVIPANVRYDRRLKANEKLLYGEITALTNERGYCWAGNKYFSDLYGVTPQAVSKWINGLKNCGYITIEYTYKDGTKEIESRIIKLASTSVSEVSTNVYEGINKCFNGYKQKVKDNNTYLNNTVNNTNEYIVDNNPTPEKKKNRFVIPSVEEVQAYCTERGNNIDAQHFVDYYSARGWMLGKNHIKDWKACVRTWERNDSFKPQKQQEQPDHRKYDQNGYESEEELMKMFYGK